MGKIDGFKKIADTVYRNKGFEKIGIGIGVAVLEWSMANCLYKHREIDFNAVKTFYEDAEIVELDIFNGNIGEHDPIAFRNIEVLNVNSFHAITI